MDHPEKDGPPVSWWIATILGAALQLMVNEARFAVSSIRRRSERGPFSLFFPVARFAGNPALDHRIFLSIGRMNRGHEPVSRKLAANSLVTGNFVAETRSTWTASATTR